MKSQRNEAIVEGHLEINKFSHERSKCVVAENIKSGTNLPISYIHSITSSSSYPQLVI